MGNNTDNYYTLITGSSAGIGKQIALECARRGFNLFLVSLPDTGLEELSEEIKNKYSVDVRYLAIDLTDYKAPRQVYDYAKNNLLRINILVNNAGIGYGGKFDNLTVENTDSMILLNIRCSTLLAMLFIPDMREMKKAHILNISSFAAFSPVPFKCVYSATKSYLFFLTQALNQELKGTGIKVSSIHPTGVNTKRTMQTVKKSAFIARISSMNPEQVAQIAVKKMLKGKKFIIPGLITKIYYTIGSFLPHGLILLFAGMVFRRKA